MTTNIPLWLSLLSGAGYLVIGIPELLRIGPRFLPPSWTAIYAVLPDALWWLWPGLFTLTGVVALLGVRLPRMAWLGFRLSATTFFIWGLVGLYAWHVGQGGNIPGSTVNLIAALYAWAHADFVSLSVASGRIETKVAELAEKVETVANGVGANSPEGSKDG